MGDGHDDSKDNGIPNPATGSHQIGCDHRLSVTGAEGMSRAVGNSEEEGQQNLPKFGFPGNDGLDDVPNLLFFSGDGRRVSRVFAWRSAGAEYRFRIGVF